MSRPVPPSADTVREGSNPRIDVIDWMRGLAVILMIQAHGFDSWLLPAAKTGVAYDVIRHMSGLPSRLFLLLVGVATAIRFEGQIRRGVPTAALRRQVFMRGLTIVGLAYLFRLQEFTLAGFKGGWQSLFRVDILNAIGSSLLVVGAVATPRGGRPQVWAAVLGAAFFLGLGPLVGPAHFPTWLPRPLTAYIGGQRPIAWFTLFPWAAWTLVGVALGHIWLRYARDPRGQARCFLATGLLGAISTGAVILIRQINPYVIRYPSELVQQMGPGSFFYRLGIIGMLFAVGWAATRLAPTGFSPMKQLGRTSLLIYWVHVDLCYGGISRPLRAHLGIAAATAWIIVLTALMLGLSLLKVRYGDAARAWFGGQLRTRAPRVGHQA